MTTHTPGPWRQEPYRNSQMLSLTIVAGEGNEYWEVATAIGWGGDRHTQSDGNARLIAAAPELLAALQDVSSAYQEMFDVMPVAWQTIDDIVTAAIAKATT